MIVAGGDLGGGVKAQGSGDAGMAAKRKLVKLARLVAPGREPNSRSGAVMTVTLAIQVAAQIRRLAALLMSRSVMSLASRAARLADGQPCGHGAGR
jgi:hypothetical protein